jgi:hypothetical protein
MDILMRIEECEREYKTINNFKGLITFQWFLSYKNPSWSKKKIVGGLKAIEEIRAAFGWNTTPTRREKQRTPHPVGAHNVATVARCLGNLIIGVGVRVRSILLRYERTVMMRHVRMD